jgi:hypothetical protein
VQHQRTLMIWLSRLDAADDRWPDGAVSTFADQDRTG